MRRSTLLAGAVLLPIIAGCAADIPLSPSDAVTPVRVPKLTISGGHFDGQRVTVYTTVGNFSIDVTNNVFELPDGKRAPLSPSRAMTMATAFQAAIDDPAGQIETALASNCSSDGNGEVCDPYNPILRPPVRSRADSPARGREKVEGVATVHRVRMGISVEDAEVAASYYPPTCSEIAVQIYNHNSAYRTNKQRLEQHLSEVFEELLMPPWQEFFMPERWAELLNRLETYFNAIQSAVLVAEVERSNFILHFLAIQYRLHGCWDANHSNWYLSSGGGGEKFVCTTETVTIVFPSGEERVYNVPYCTYHVF